MQTDLQEVNTTVDQHELTPQAVPFSAISKVKHIQTDNVYVKTTYVPQNVKFYTKRTPDNHVAILAHGEMVVENQGEQVRLKAPANYIVPAGKRITCYTLTDCVFYCVHSTQETDLEKLDQLY